MRKIKIIGILAIALLLSFGMLACKPDKKDPVLTEISVTKNPTKMEYIVGDTFEKAGMIVTAKYDDDSTSPVTDYTCSPNTALKLSDTTITVTYEGKDTTLTIKVKEVASISIKTPPSKTRYVAGDAFVSAGMVVEVSYTDGSKQNITTGFEVSPTTLTASSTEVTVTYKGQTAKQAVAMLKSISITTPPTKTDYINGELFDKAGMVVEALYADDSTETVTNYTITPAVAFTGDETEVKVAYGGMEASQSVSVKVLTAVTLSGSYTTSYITGETFDATGLVVTASFNKGDDVILTSTEYDYTAKGRALKKADETAGITFTYRDKSATVAVTVFVPVTGITLSRTAQPLAIGMEETATLTYTLRSLEAGVEPDVKGVTWSISDDSIATVVSGLVTLKGKQGDTVVTVTADDDSYNGPHSATCIVKADYPIGIETAEDFLNIFTNRTGYYFLANDIDFSTGVDSEGDPIPGELSVPKIKNLEWAPENALQQTQEDDTFFSGVFDGRGFTISNLKTLHTGYIGNASNTTYGNSIFGVIGKGGVVKNLGVSGFTADGSGQTCVIAAHNFGTIENCRFEDIYLSCAGLNDNQCAGAVIAAFNYNVIRDCVVASAYSDVTGGNARILSFIVRNRQNGSVVNCFAATDGLVYKAMSNFEGGSFAGSSLFEMADIATVSFAALGTANWTLTAGSLPVLKGLGTPIINEMTGITLNTTAETLQVRAEIQLTATIAPLNTTYRGIVWSSSDATAVTVDKTGYIKVIDASATPVVITAKSQKYPGIFETCTITVSGIIKLETFEISADEQTLIIDRIGDTVPFRLTSQIGPQYAVAPVTWESDDEEVATVNANGVVTAVAVGTCVITATATDTEGAVTKTATCDIEVVRNMDKIKLYSSSVPDNSYICNISTATNPTNPSLEFARGPSPDGRDESYGKKYLSAEGQSICAGLQIAVYDTADESAPIGYFWVVDINGVGCIVPSLDPNDEDALAKKDGVSIVLDFAGLPGFRNLYLATANTKAAFIPMVKAMKPEMTGAKTFKIAGRYVAVDDAANDYATGDWGALTTKTFTMTF